MVRKTKEEWILIIEDAARSNLSAAAYCRKNGIPVNQFYKMTHRLGYTKGGERTEKWHSAANQESAQTQNGLELVPVPLKTVREAAAASGQPATAQPQIVIQYESFKVALGDGFSQTALQRALEVIVNA